MPVSKLALNEPLTGLLVDGVEDTPYVAGTLTLTEKGGVQVAVPFVHSGEAEGQFSHVDREWFGRNRTPPKNMALHTPTGAISLYDVRWQGTSIRTGVSLGTLKPSETVLKDRDGDLSAELTVKKMQSNVDGLRQFARISSVTDETEADEHGKIQKLLISVERSVGLTWQQGDATLSIHSTWSTEYPDETLRQGMNILDDVVIVSEFDEPRSFLEHYTEQRKVAYLMTFIFGTGIYFRRHQVSDERFTEKLNGGRVIGTPFYEAYSSRTVREYNQPLPTRTQLQDAYARLASVGAEGLKAWSDAFTPWARFILPAHNVLTRRDNFAEDVVSGLAMSMEAYAHNCGTVKGEEVTYSPKGKRPITATWMWRCLETLGLDWSAIAPSTAALSHAIANNYNDVKHAARGSYPEGDHSYLVAQVCRLVVRLLAMRLVDPTGQLVADYGQDYAVGRVTQRFNDLGWRLDERGTFVPVLG